MKRLYRSRHDRVVAGLCGGLGEYLEVDPNLVRIAVVLLTLSTGIIPGLITYLVAWAIVPSKQ